jgi:hypothetical protein
MSDISNAEGVLRLIANDQISRPDIRKEALKTAATTILGKDSGLIETITSINPDDTQEIKKIVSDLRSLAAGRTRVENPSIHQLQLPSDDEIKDRVSRVFMSSLAFKICSGVLALGAALFGINMGVLTFDTAAANRIKTEAAIAANDAKQQADNAKNSIAAAISTVQVNMDKLINDKIDIQAVQQRVAVIVSDKLDGKIGELDKKIKNTGTSINDQNTQIDANKQKIGDIQKTIDKSEAKYQEAERLFGRWQSAVEVANKTTADQTLARFVWLVLRWDGWFLTGSVVFSLAALVLAVWGFFNSRHALANSRP